MRIKDSFQYRSVWMGIAIIYIVFFHFPFYLDSSYPTLNRVVEQFHFQGFMGVDIFFFASGLGCYYSLKKNDDVLAFIKRRAIRFFPVYLPFLAIWTIYLYWKTNTFSFPSLISDIYCVKNFTMGESLNWYFSAMWVSYFLAPYLVKWVDKCNTAIKVIVTLAITLGFSIPFWGTYFNLIAAIRLTDFVAGILVAKYGDYFIDKKKFITMNALLAVVEILYIYTQRRYSYDFLSYYGLIWYPFVIVAPIVCFDMSVICRKICNSNIGKNIIKVLALAGGISLELLLVHVLLENAYTFLLATGQIVGHRYDIVLYYIAAFVFSFLLMKIGSVVKITDKPSKSS